MVDLPRCDDRREQATCRAADREPPVELGQASRIRAVCGELSVAQQGGQEEGAEVEQRQCPEWPASPEQDQAENRQRIERKDAVEEPARNQRTTGADDREGN